MLWLLLREGLKGFKASLDDVLEQESLDPVEVLTALLQSEAQKLAVLLLEVLELLLLTSNLACQRRLVERALEEAAEFLLSSKVSGHKRQDYTVVEDFEHLAERALAKSVKHVSKSLVVILGEVELVEFVRLLEVLFLHCLFRLCLDVIGGFVVAKLGDLFFDHFAHILFDFVFVAFE